MGASMPLLSGLPAGQLLGGFSAAGALGLQQGQHMYNGQLTQPAAYAALPGQLPYQVRHLAHLFVPFYLLRLSSFPSKGFWSDNRIGLVVKLIEILSGVISFKEHTFYSQKTRCPRMTDRWSELAHSARLLLRRIRKV